MYETVPCASLIIYTDDDKLVEKTKKKHGNSKNPKNMFVRTKQSVIHQLKSQLKINKPHVIYGKLGGNESRPRDLKQRQNSRYAFNFNKRINKDEPLYGGKIVVNESMVNNKINIHPKDYDYSSIDLTKFAAYCNEDALSSIKDLLESLLPNASSINNAASVETPPSYDDGIAVEIPPSDN